MPKLVSIQDRGGWAIAGFRAGQHTVHVDKELASWRVLIRGQRVFLIKGTQVEEIPRDDVRLRWELLPGETEEVIETLQKWTTPVPGDAEKKGAKK